MPLVACVTLPHFPLEFELAAHPILRGLPVVIGGSPEEARQVVDCSAEAEREGVRIGMPLRQVLAICHQAVFLTARPALYRDRFAGLARALEAISPVVEPDTLGTCYVDLSGVLQLYGGVEGTGQALNEAATAALDTPPALPPGEPAEPRAASRPPSIGIAGGKFAAQVAATMAEPGTPLVVPENETADFLAPLAIDLLPVPEELRARLLRFGLTTLGELAALPVTAVQAQLGPAGRRAWSLAGGAARERPNYRPPAETIAQGLTFPAPATSTATLRIALDHLLAQGFARPERKGRGVRQVRLLMRIEEGSRWERIITFRDPAIDHRAAAAAIAPQLEGLALSGAVEEMAVVLQEFAAEVGRQEGLFPEKGKRLRQLAGSLKQLKAQYQRPLLARVVEVEPWSRIPENRMALIDYDP